MDHFFPASEEEVIGVEHLLAEPKCNNLGDDVLGFNTLSQHTGFNFEDFSTVGSGSIKTDNDPLDSSLNRSKKVKEFPNGMVGGVEAMVLDRKSNLSDTCEDYLLDTEFVDEALDFNLIKGSYTGKLGPESESTGSVGRECGDERSESATVRFPVLQASFQDSSLLDKMTIDELHEAFRNMFGCETAVTDQQWLKSHLSFGLQNLLVPSDENEGKMISPVSDQCSRRVFSPSMCVFNFKKKPRVQHVRRERHDNHASLKALSSDDRKALFGFSELIEQENALITSKRSRKPPRRYIEESLEQNSRHRKKRHGISNTCSRDKILHNGSYKQHNSKGREAKTKTFVCQKVPFKGACIQVPFGQPVCRKQLTRKVHESDNCKASRPLGSNVDSDMESFSTKSQDDTFEDDYSTGTRKGKSRRKNHMYWSVSEVLKLVEGVSMYGVGRWTEIKRLLFHSSPIRTSVDLKDKWRNLLRASWLRLQSNREVESRKKHGSQSIPLSILHRVRELAVIYPYPRERKTQVSQTASVASPIPGTSTSCDNLLPLSTAVRV
ncbi:uncharacterized protein LOC130762810 isoform X2 [Actinidia eriantha]|uniref:uncharacterized protein LOC130762810 isoform X2 n=1 Tax=Actinidia eriantha TaxID=165200 RepID=UPI00258E8D92|nr:uncharacterized protein LOC130762810 isoform X2 [Actinidia eriantha]